MPGTPNAVVRGAEPVAGTPYPDRAAAKSRRAARGWLAAARRHGRAPFAAAGLADVLAAGGVVLGCWNIATLIVAGIGSRTSTREPSRSVTYSPSFSIPASCARY
ncbi:MAG: hypothetical protein QOK11_800, partial [Pseudonocardiales bacterium]|nr:hypothetical protein [Pseudonocardiales bacterium]